MRNDDLRGERALELEVLGYTTVNVAASNDVPDFLQSIIGTSSTPWNASVNELYSPTMGTLFSCYRRAFGRVRGERRAADAAIGTGRHADADRQPRHRRALAQRKLRRLVTAHCERCYARSVATT